MKTANKAKEELIKVIEEVKTLSQYAAETEKIEADYKQTEPPVQEVCC